MGIAYISTKLVVATSEPRIGIDKGPMDGMHLVYQDGYESWCPIEVFHRDYQPTSAMGFGAALFLMEKGHKVRRSGWNGKDMWIAKGQGGQVAAENFWNEHTKAFAVTQPHGVAEVAPYVLMKTADGKIVMGWLASQTDIFAQDWELVP